MNTDFAALIDESLNLEFNVSNLYFMFHKMFPEDSDFWWKLVLEERGHAALIRTGKEHFEPIGKFPHDLLASVLTNLTEINATLKSLIKKYERNPPSREEAFNVAHDIENSSGELEFQKFMDEKTDSKIREMFRSLNMDEKDHAKRINAYMESHGIVIR